MLGFFVFLTQLEFFFKAICFNFDKVGSFILLEDV